ncbi:hypothetical protein Trydic_g21360 [Trypoxylus dichotomus]
MSDKVNKFISEFPDLMYDGAKIKCLVCDRPLLCWTKYDCRRHVNSAQHKCKETGVQPNSQFLFDLSLTMITCNVPFHLLNNESFHLFWKRYANRKLPSRTTLRNYVPFARDEIENRIKSVLRDKKLWLCVDKTTDCKKNSIVNVIVRTMEPHKPSPSILLASKRVQRCTAEVISKVVLNALEKFELSRNQLLMFVTDDATNMHSVGRSLKDDSGNFLHVTCKINALHLVVETIRRCYPQVDGLIAHTKAVFLKSPKRIREFRRQCPDIPGPPQPILTQCGAWLKAAFYYFQHFQRIKSVVLEFDPKDATAIKQSQKKFQDAQVEADLEIIYNNYNGVVEAIDKLQNPSLSLVESLKIVDTIQTQLRAFSDAKNINVIAKMDTVLKKDSGFTQLKCICSDNGSTDPLSIDKDYFNFCIFVNNDRDIGAVTILITNTKRQKKIVQPKPRKSKTTSPKF